MLSNTKIQHVQSLLANGHSHRETAARSGVSHTTVLRIAKGERQLQPAKVAFQMTPPYRCPSCGGLVTLSPCPACQARKYTQ